MWWSNFTGGMLHKLVGVNCPWQNFVAVRGGVVNDHPPSPEKCLERKCLFALPEKARIGA